MRTEKELREATRALAKAPYWAVGRILVDLVLWGGAAILALQAGAWWATGLAIAFIGALPLHDLLVHGHDGTHRMISRIRPLNEFFLWLTHAFSGISGTAYRAFHLDHHRFAQTDRDPEVRLIRRLSGGRGWGYLLLPLASHLAVNGYPFYAGKRVAIRGRTILELAAAVALHASLAIGLGLRPWLLFCVAPVFTSLGAVVILRSICEHHGTGDGDRWSNTRTMKAGRLVELLWSNTNYHLEHHLAPHVPFQRMPELRRLLIDHPEGRRIVLGRGYVRTAFALLREPEHVKRRTA
jgi:fatty acid desaturase